MPPAGRQQRGEEALQPLRLRGRPPIALEVLRHATQAFTAWPEHACGPMRPGKEEVCPLASWRSECSQAWRRALAQALTLAAVNPGWPRLSCLGGCFPACRASGACAHRLLGASQSRTPSRLLLIRSSLGLPKSVSPQVPDWQQTARLAPRKLWPPRGIVSGSGFHPSPPRTASVSLHFSTVVREFTTVFTCAGHAGICLYLWVLLQPLVSGRQPVADFNCSQGGKFICCLPFLPLPWFSSAMTVVCLGI